ncbi:MAG: putative lipoprotein [Polaromonas sp.]|nr:putative lipoprotein [Polaromonas sp.]
MRPLAVLMMPVMMALAGLSACGEKPQTLDAAKGQGAAYHGAQNAFVAPGWKAGDKGSWEQGLKTRLQNTQNEYTKIN